MKTATNIAELSGLLIADLIKTPNGSVDSIATPTLVGGNKVSAILELQSTTRGLLVPRMTTAQRNAIPVVTGGFIIYNLDEDDFNLYTNGQWEKVSSGDVFGPNVSVAGNVPFFADTTGKLLADSGVQIANVNPPPLSLFSEVTRAENSTVNQIGNLGWVQFVSGAGGIYVDSLSPVGFYEAGGQICTVFTDGIPQGPTNPSALVELNTTTGALLISRMTTTQRNALTGTNGMIVYDITIGAFYGYQGGIWVPVDTSGGTVTQINQGTGITCSPNPIVGVGTISLSNTAVTAGSYTVPSLTINAQGQVTSAASASRIIDTNSTTTNVFVGFSAGNLTTTGNGNCALGYGSLSSNTSGIGNCAYGYGTLVGNQNGTGNSAFGYVALISNVSGQFSSAFGAYALQNNTANYNSAFGAHALGVNTGGTPNNAFGYQALASNLNGFANDSFGYNASFLNTSGAKNSAFGYQSSYSNLTGNQNCGFGGGTLYFNTASNNSAFGYTALYNNTSGSGSAFGCQSLYSNTTGTNNSAFGYQSLYSNTTGQVNCAFGDLSLTLNTSGGANSAFGYQSLGNNTTANSGCAFGKYALASNTTGSDNCSVGVQSLFNNTTGTQNCAFGSQSLQNNVTGNYNTAYGYGSLLSNTASSNCAFGNSALINNTSGSSSCAFGTGALNTITTSGSCSAFGYNALYSNTAVNNNAFGYQALKNNSSGTPNDAHGYNALTANTSGTNNCAFGYLSLSRITTSSNCSAFGANAGSAQLAYTNCTFIGENSDASVNSLSNATAIGYNASVAVSNALVLGNGSASVGINDSSPGSLLSVVGNAQIGFSSGTTSTTNGLVINGSVGLGTNIVATRFVISGTDSNYANGPHIQTYTGVDAYPLFQALSWTHNDIRLNFDSYFNGTNAISSNVTSNFQIRKNTSLNFNYATGVAQGSTITWSTGIVLSTLGNVGIGTASPNAPLQFQNSISNNRTITLYETTNNQHQIYGFGVNNGVLRYQVDGSGSNHVFYCGASSSTSTELFRVGGNGSVGINTTTPATKFVITGSNGNYANGPHIQTYTSDAYPVMQILSWQHNEMSINFDCYFNGSNNLSSNSTSNFAIRKSTNLLFTYASGVAQGNAITFVTGMQMNSSGQIGIGASPSYSLHLGTANNAPLIYMASTAVPSAPGTTNDGIFSVATSKPTFTSGTAIASGTLVTAKTGASGTSGTATLNGTTGVTVSTTAINTSSIVLVTRNTGTGAPTLASTGELTVGSITANTSFNIYSANTLDTMVVNWQIINP